MTVTIRSALVEADRDAVRRVVLSTGFFDAAEVDIAVELVDAHLERGEASGYLFRLAEVADPGGARVAGYTCFGAIPGTRSSWDLYWIAVEDGRRGLGLGRALLAATEAEVVARGGTRLYADTSSRAQYAPTHAFYRASGFAAAAHLEDYYAPGDGRLTFAKVLGPA